MGQARLRCRLTLRYSQITHKCVGSVVASFAPLRNLTTSGRFIPYQTGTTFPQHKIGNGDTTIQTQLEGPHKRMHSKSRGYKIHPEYLEPGSKMRRFTTHSHISTTCKAKASFKYAAYGKQRSGARTTRAQYCPCQTPKFFLVRRALPIYANQCAHMGDRVAEKISIGGTDLRLRRRELKVVLPQLLEKLRT